MERALGATNPMRQRAVIFLGLFSLLALAVTGASAVAVERDLIRSKLFADIAWASAVPILAYLGLSLRALAKKPQ